MADASELNGLKNIDTDGNNDEPAEGAKADQPTTYQESPSDPGQNPAEATLANPSLKNSTMDKDNDGAPSSTETSPRRQRNGSLFTEKGAGDGGSIVFFDSSAESTPRRSAGMSKSVDSSIHDQSKDLSGVDMKSSWDGSAKAGMLADPVKIAKEREREERVRQARERLAEERRKKLEELKEQQRMAQENREKQLEMRRKKIEDLRRRDVERRAAVEERRKMKEEVERARRESILQKAEERVARYEAWKAGGRKGGRGHMLGFGSGTPRDICQPFERPRRSSSHNALVRRSPNGSDMDSVRPQRRALSACSAVRRHCCVDINRMALNSIPEGRRSFLGTAPSTPALPASYHRGTVGGGNLARASMTASMPSPVQLREKAGRRKQRPASVASSMPSFVGGEPAKSPRSKSSDRTSRDRSKTRPSRREEKSAKDKENQSEKAQKQTGARDSNKEEGKDKKETPERKGRVSLSIFDRLATPKFSKGQPEQNKDTPPTKKESPIIRLSPRKAFSTTNLATMRKRSSTREKAPTPRDSTPRQPSTPTAKDTTPKQTSTPKHSTPKSTSKDTPRVSTPTSTPNAPASSAGSNPSTPRVTPPPTSAHTPVSAAASPVPTQQQQSTVAATASSEDGTTTTAATKLSGQDITAEEYKAKLAEKRRQAREKAEREAEEERKRQEEARLAEEERLRKEEEEQRKQEEEALHMAAEARKAEEERLQKAIEAEEKRKKEEAERLEQERLLKEEADRKAKEEAERLEKEKQEKARRDEEERMERKKKLEMIMKRVKTDTPGDTLSKAETIKSLTTSPIRNVTGQASPSHNSPEEHEKPVVVSAEESVSVADGGEAAAPSEGGMTTTTTTVETSSTQDATSEASPPTEVETSSTMVVRSASSGDILDGTSSFLQAKTEGEEAPSFSTGAVETTPSKDEATSTPEGSATESKSKFKSPLLQHLVENKGGDSGDRPKFKSPLLQNLLGKTKVGARMGLSSSMGDLSQGKDLSGGHPASPAGQHAAGSGPAAAGDTGSTKEISKQGKDEDKDEDTSVAMFASTPEFGVAPASKSFTVKPPMVNGVANDFGVTTLMSSSKASSEPSPPEGIMGMMSDSALGSSIEPSGEGEVSAGPGMMSQSFMANGHGQHQDNAMEDSSISLRSMESVPNSASVTATSSAVQQGQGDSQFEELIDLLDTPNNKSSALVSGTPIIAFEENNRRTDVSESLS